MCSPSERALVAVEFDAAARAGPRHRRRGPLPRLVLARKSPLSPAVMPRSSRDDCARTACAVQLCTVYVRAINKNGGAMRVRVDRLATLLVAALVALPVAVGAQGPDSGADAPAGDDVLAQLIEGLSSRHAG